MNIDEAIQRNTDTRAFLLLRLDSDAAEALQLGIEALKRIKLQRDPGGCITDRVLPGETEY